MFDLYQFTIEFRDKVYGGIPKNERIMDAWLAAQRKQMKLFEPSDEQRATLGLVSATEMAERITQEALAEAGELEESVEAGETKFRRDEQGLYLRDFQVKANLKESSQRQGLWMKLKRNEDGMGLKSHMQTGLYVTPPRLYLMRDGKILSVPDGEDEAQGRVPTPKGPKSILRRSEYVERAQLTVILKMLPFKGFAEKQLREVLELGQEIGLGAWRSREEGKFDVLSFSKMKE